jgi:hypothetical protein
MRISVACRLASNYKHERTEPFLAMRPLATIAVQLSTAWVDQVSTSGGIKASATATANHTRQRRNRMMRGRKPRVSYHSPMIKVNYDCPCTS